MPSDLNNELSKMTGARQTMTSWSKVIESFESVPEAYKNSYQAAVGNIQPFPYTVFAPSIPGLRRHNLIERLICEVDHCIYVWERSSRQITLTEYPLSTISTFEIGRILLFSWLTISGLNKAGVTSTSTIEFNTSSARHYVYFIDKLRSAAKLASHHEQSGGKVQFDYLAEESFKFMNFAAESLMGGEKILKTLWQSEISKPLVTVWGHVFYRSILSMAHLIILTDREFILIQDDERSTESCGVRYGGKWQYIALDKIRAASLLDRVDDFMTLSLVLSHEVKPVEIIFPVSRRQELLEFKAAIEKALTASHL